MLDNLSNTKEVIPKPLLELTPKELKSSLSETLRELKQYRGDICNPDKPSFKVVSRDVWEELNTHIYRLQTIVDSDALLKTITRAANAKYAK